MEYKWKYILITFKLQFYKKKKLWKKTAPTKLIILP